LSGPDIDLVGVLRGGLEGSNSGLLHILQVNLATENNNERLVGDDRILLFSLFLNLPYKSGNTN
jgi:hypothetical protein